MAGWGPQAHVRESFVAAPIAMPNWGKHVHTMQCIAHAPMGATILSLREELYNSDATVCNASVCSLAPGCYVLGVAGAVPAASLLPPLLLAAPAGPPGRGGPAGAGGVRAVVRRIQGTREAEVAQLQGGSSSQQHVLRLDIPMHHLREHGRPRGHCSALTKLSTPVSHESRPCNIHASGCKLREGCVIPADAQATQLMVSMKWYQWKEGEFANAS